MKGRKLLLIIIAVFGVIFVSAFLFINQKPDDPLTPLYSKALNDPLFDKLEEGTETVLYFSSSAQEIKQLIAPHLDSSWVLKDHNNGNYSFTRGQYESISIVSDIRQMSGAPAESKAKVVYFRPGIFNL